MCLEVTSGPSAGGSSAEVGLASLMTTLEEAFGDTLGEPLKEWVGVRGPRRISTSSRSTSCTYSITHQTGRVQLT